MDGQALLSRSSEVCCGVIEGGMYSNQVDKQFGVEISTVIGWMQRLDEIGSVTPGQMGGNKSKKI